MQANELCPSPHIEAAELNDADKTVTICGIDFHDVGEEKTTKGVVFFKEFGDRAMVMNRTAGRRASAVTRKVWCGCLLAQVRRRACGRMMWWAR